MVIEDSFSGVKAAQAAGLQVIHCRMAELAPVSDQTTYHACTFEQVEKLMIEGFGIPLCPSVLDNVTQQGEVVTPRKTTANALQIILSTARNSIWAEKYKSQERDNFGLKLPSGNIRLWPDEKSTDSTIRFDESRPNRAYYK